jgi:hypothetical protein
MPYTVVLSVLLLIAGFWMGGVISEVSLRGVDPAEQGRLLSSLAPLRKAHLIGIPLILGIGFLFPAYFWGGLVAYFGLGTALAIVRLWRLGLPSRLRNGQALSVASVFLGVLLGAGAAYAL